MGIEQALAGREGFLTSTTEAVLGWARKWSLFQYPFVTACCGMEFMAVMNSHYDMARFGAEIPRFTPRQSDLLLVVGTVNHKLSPVLLRVWEQMADPKWVIAIGACASTGGVYDNYAALPGIDHIIPVDVYVAGCPPRPESILKGLMLLQEKISKRTLLDDYPERAAKRG